MAAYYHYNAQQHPTAAHPPQAHHAHPHAHHGGRSRRAPRLATAQHSKQFRGVRSMKELTETASIATFRQKFEAGRSFDLEDDLEFCPNLLTEDDHISIHSASDRSSLSSNSPESSPTQQPQQVSPNFSLNSASAAYIPAYHQQTANLKLHQPAATRIRSAIPIVNPSTGLSLSSPPQSVSPARMHQARRW